MFRQDQGQELLRPHMFRTIIFSIALIGDISNVCVSSRPTTDSDTHPIGYPVVNLINRPSVAGAVLQSPPSLTDSAIL